MSLSESLTRLLVARAPRYARAGVSAIVVLSHMDLKDSNVYKIQEAVRGYASEVPELADMPLQFITGHTHYRGWTKVDDHSSSFEEWSE